MKKHGIVLVGCGYMGASHMDDMYFRDNIEIRGVVDIDKDKACRFARKYGALSWNCDYHGYLDDPDTDIFIIATYPSTHLSILKECLRHNKNVLCEKPIAGTMEEAGEFVRTAKASGSKVLIGHILRHNATYNKVADMIRQGAIGSPMVMRMVQNKHAKDWNRLLELIRETSPIIDCGVHYIDVMQWFTGSRITSVSGIGARTEYQVADDSYNYGMFCARLEDGSVGYFEAGWGNTIATADVKEFIGPKGRIRITYQKDRRTDAEEGDLIEYYNSVDHAYENININGQRKPTWDQLQYLIRMIEENVQAVPSLDEVYRVFQIAVAADRAVRTGQTMPV